MGAYQNRNNAIKDLKKIAEDPAKVLFVHYSVSRTFDDDYGEISPIITSIVVKSLDYKVDVQFAIHFEADKAGLPKEEIQESYRELELRLLRNFNSYVKRNSHCIWVHWEMKNIHFGFEAIKQRFEKIFENLADYHEIPTNQKFNLKVILEGMYGENFVPGPDELKSLIHCNNGKIVVPEYQSKDSESAEFINKNFDVVISSTDCKVDFIRKAFKKLLDKKLLVTNRNNYAIFIDIVAHPMFNLISFVVGTILGVWGVYLSLK